MRNFECKAKKCLICVFGILAKNDAVCDNCCMTKTNAEIFGLLEQMHSDAGCELNFTTPFELLVAVVLSAQCTDKRVNIITKELFKAASTPEAFVNMPLEELEHRIFSAGFYHNKAKAIKLLSQSIIEKGGMPATRDELMQLDGVGRKTANVVYVVAYGGNAIPVDTHVFRVSRRIGLADANTPEKVERQLMTQFDEELWGRLHHLLLFHGRYICKAQTPDCGVCLLQSVCNYYKKCEK
jgi:endonuclease-3